MDKHTIKSNLLMGHKAELFHAAQNDCGDDHACKKDLTNSLLPTF